MKYIAFTSANASEKIDRIERALESSGFERVLPPKDVDVFDEPVVLFWSKDFGITDPKLIERLKATAAAERLISVLIEKTTLPEDLPKHPIVDLVNWRGSPRNAFFQDLRRNLEAAVQKEPPPRPAGPVFRLVQRMCAGLTVGVVLAFLFAFALNLLELQNNLCSINFVQPNVSDFCGEWGLGDKPTREERLAWEGREPGSCEALRAHIDRFGETGALHGLAADLLDARRIVVEEKWQGEAQSQIFSQSVSSDGAATPETAKAVAMEDAMRTAEASCSAFAESDFYRYVGFELEATEWDCFELSSGHYCGFDGQNTCELQRLVRTNTEVCGPQGE